MPCRDDGPWPTAEEMKKYYAKRKEIEFEFYKSKVDELTNMLCALGGEIEKFDSKILTHKFPDIGNWYYLHRQADLTREEREIKEKEKQIAYKQRQIQELRNEIKVLKKEE